MSAELNLINAGDTKGVYRILLRNLRTNDQGEFSIAEKAQGDELFADKFIH